MTAILGISAYYHDSAAALVIDGKIIAAAQEERFTRRKHDSGFPRLAIDHCLQSAGLRIEDLDYVGFYEKPLAKFDRLIETHLASAPWSYPSFRQAIPRWVMEKLRLAREIRCGLDGKFTRRFVFCDHHQSHAASAFFPSPFDEAAILTVDGVGEWATACYGMGRKNQIELTHEMRFPHSLGLLYSAFTEYLGLGVNSGEYKVMGLAAYGLPVFEDIIFDRLVKVLEDGSFRMDMRYFHYCRGLTMTNRRFHRLFGSTPREPDSPITQHAMDIAASIQAVTEKIMLRMVHKIHQATGCPNLVMAGGVALNSVANGVIARDGPFQNIWVQPAAGDAGGALGTALLIDHQLLGRQRDPEPTDRQQGSFLGPAFGSPEILRALETAEVTFHTCDSDEKLCDTIAKHLSEQRTVGWFQGRMEYGPRALGARSILADPRNENMKSRLNEQVKHRESFRPFAPVVLQEHASDYFDVTQQDEFPFMHAVVTVKCPIQFAAERHNSTAPNGIEPLSAVTHVDQTARLQTADAKRHPLLRMLLQSFRRRTSCPALINTSFNLRGEPIVCRPIDAIRCFLNTDLDVLAMGRHILLKDEQDTAKLSGGQHVTQTDNDAEPGRLTFHRLWRPTSRQLRRFGTALVVALPLAGWMFRATSTTVGGLAFLGIMGALTGWLRPVSLKPIYLLATVPLAILISEIGLLGIYFGLVWPMGLVSRLFGRDTLQCRQTSQASTYWKPREQPSDPESYFRQS